VRRDGGCIWHEHTLCVTFRAEVVGGGLGDDLQGDVKAVAWKEAAEAQRLMPCYDDLSGLLTAAAPYQSRRDP